MLLPATADIRSVLVLLLGGSKAEVGCLMIHELAGP